MTLVLQMYRKFPVDRPGFLCLLHGQLSVIVVFLAVLSGNATAQTDGLQYGLSPAYGTPMAPELDLTGLDGKRYRLSDYRGKVVIVNFWATWCPPCISEMPTLQSAWDRLHDGNFEVLAVNLGEDADTIQRFVDNFEPKLSFPILMARDQSIMTTWRIQGLPTSYILDTSGRWTYAEVGPRDFSHEHVISRLQDLMAGSANE